MSGIHYKTHANNIFIMYMYRLWKIELITHLLLVCFKKENDCRYDKNIKTAVKIY